jgi:hypothetical protein
MTFKNIFPFLLLLAALASGCRKEPGEGGLATVQGKVWARDLDKDGFVKTEGYIGDERVFIGVDGENTSFESVRTSFDGSYRFSFLRKGNYKVWVFSRCDSCVLEQATRIQTTTVDARKETITLPDFSIDI